jgi:hypothetical protein
MERSDAIRTIVSAIPCLSTGMLIGMAESLAEFAGDTGPPDPGVDTLVALSVLLGPAFVAAFNREAIEILGLRAEPASPVTSALRLVLPHTGMTLVQDGLGRGLCGRDHVGA